MDVPTQAKRENSLFLHLFVRFKPSGDWMVLTSLVEGDFLKKFIYFIYFPYFFGCIETQLQHTGSLLRRVGSFVTAHSLFVAVHRLLSSGVRVFSL